MVRNENKSAAIHDAIAVARSERFSAPQVLFALTLTIAIILLSLQPIAHASTTSDDPGAIVKGTVGQVLEVLSDKQAPLESRRVKCSKS
jgi:hypothetical protein